MERWNRRLSIWSSEDVWNGDVNVGVSGLGDGLGEGYRGLKG